MPNQLAEGTMNIDRRKELQDLQDAFLAHPRLVNFASVYGETWELFGPGTPSTKELREFVHPEYESTMREFLAKGFTS